MKTDLPWHLAGFKVAANRLGHLLLEITQIGTLRGDAAGRGVPGGGEHARNVAGLDLKNNLVHAFTVRYTVAQSNGH